MHNAGDGSPSAGLEDRLRALENRLTAIEKALAGSSPGRAPRLPSLLRRGATDLEDRIAEVESELQESRRLNMRLAELTDIVQELLVPMVQRDHELLEDRLKRYSASL